MEAAGAGPSSSEGEHVRVYDIQACFAAHGGGSIDELSGRTTGRLGYIRPTTAHAIGGTAELALRYSYHLCIFRRAEPLQGATTGRTVLQEYGATPSYPPGPQDLSGTTGRAGAANAAADAAGAAVPFRDYGPYSYRIFLEKAQIFLQNAGFFCKFIETRQKILRYIRSDVAYVGPRPILS